MEALRFTRPLRVLTLGAHCDDIEIGCGGTLLKLIGRGDVAEVRWVVFSSTDTRRAEAEAGAAAVLRGGPPYTVDVQTFRDGYFPFHGAAIKDHFEQIARDFAPDLVFTHRLDDRHQDHRTVAELTWNTFRNHLIFEYEIAKYEGDLGHPNVYVPLSVAEQQAKIEAIIGCYPSQRMKPWFTEDTFRGLMRLRGVECNAPDQCAEAFHARKLAL